MAKINQIFTVIDPTTKNQRALNRAVLGAKSTGARIHAYLCIASNMDADHFHDFIEAETSKYQTWIDDLIEPIRADGIDIDVEIERHDDWRSAMGPAATRSGCDLIIKNAHQRLESTTTSLSSSDWSLFRSAPCPVMIAKSERSSGSGNVLVAIDSMKEDGAYEKVIDETLGFARVAVASYREGTLHVLSAYAASYNKVNAPNLAERTGVETEHIHVSGERVEEAIEKCATDIDAELIVIGVMKTPRLSGVLFGTTTEWLLNHLDRDIMVVIPQNA